MDQIIALLEQVNVAQTIVILSGFWVFYNRLDKKIEKLDNKLEKLEGKLEDVDRRLCRIEGSLTIHGHCLFHQSTTDKKAE